MTCAARKRKQQIARKRKKQENAQLAPPKPVSTQIVAKSITSTNLLKDYDSNDYDFGYSDDENGTKIDPGFFKRMIYEGDQRRDASYTAFHDPIDSLPIPFTKLDISDEATSGRDRGLCANCAGFDWHYHLIGSKLGFKKINKKILTRTNKKRTWLNKYGNEIEITSYSTSFLLPRLATILANQDICTVCSLIACTLRAEATQAQIDHIARDREPVKCKFLDWTNAFLHDGSCLHVRLCSDEKAAMGSWDVVDLRFTLKSLPEEDDPWDDGYMERYMAYNASRDPLNPTQIKPSTMRDWWQTCKSSHRPACEHLTASPLADRENARFRVIDVQSERIVVAPPECVYVALSYVWGNVEAYMTLACDKVVPETDEEEEYIPLQTDRLPQTIRDAISVVRILGEQYLWVDALCIVQDDESEKMASISSMDQIYRCAALTIIVASGVDANAGLAGVRGGSRNIQSLVGSVEGIELMRIDPDPEIDRTPWAARAWTYQEEQLSTRALIFAHNRVYYQCKEGSYRESRPELKQEDRLLKQDIGRKLPSIWHDMDQSFYEYTCHIQRFTSRKMKYGFDVLNAVEGVMGDLRNRYSMLNAWGLPLSFLMFALSWRRADTKVGLKRRHEGSKYKNGLTFLSGTAGAQKNAEQQHLIPFPSWSWAGWEGAVTYDWFEHPRVECFSKPDDSDDDESDKDHSAYQYLRSQFTWPWKQFDETAVPFITSIFSTGILEFEATMLTLHHDDIKKYTEHMAEDDSCEICAGGHAIHTRDLIMDDGSVWTEGSKKAISLHSIGYGGEDYCSYTVLIIKEDEETGIWYREGIVDLQPREWKKAKGEREKIWLG